jgi:hypothetical protein
MAYVRKYKKKVGIRQPLSTIEKENEKGRPSRRLFFVFLYGRHLYRRKKIVYVRKTLDFLLISNKLIP